MTSDDYDELIKLLDGRIDQLTNPIPSRKVLRFAQAIRSAKLGDQDSVGTYGNDDYKNLVDTLGIVNELLPAILENIRANSIDPETGWRLEEVSALNGDHGACAICDKPFQHLQKTVRVDHLDSRSVGACRECVRHHAPVSFLDSEGVQKWLDRNPNVSDRVEDDDKDEQRLALIDAIRKHAVETHYFAEISKKASNWARGALGEWR